ncbi:hypothetical protein FQN54_003549 [Arachnomyces sp. PD_36]|nr:hypothetical protein FQN54_003549 [Arachnomyces sp. PD_36]
MPWYIPANPRILAAPEPRFENQEPRRSAILNTLQEQQGPSMGFRNRPQGGEQTRVNTRPSFDWQRVASMAFRRPDAIVYPEYSRTYGREEAQRVYYSQRAREQANVPNLGMRTYYNTATVNDAPAYQEYPRAYHEQDELQRMDYFRRTYSQRPREQTNVPNTATGTYSNPITISDTETSPPRKRKRPTRPVQAPANSSSSKRQKRGPSPPRTPENKYPYPVDVESSGGSSGNGIFFTAEQSIPTEAEGGYVPLPPPANQRPNYLKVKENGKTTYQKFSPIPFDIHKDSDYVDTPSVSGSGSDEMGFVDDSSVSFGDLVDFVWDGAGPSERDRGRNRIAPTRTRGAESHGQDTAPNPRRYSRGNDTRDIPTPSSQDAPEWFYQPVRMPGPSKSNTRAPQATPDGSYQQGGTTRGPMYNDILEPIETFYMGPMNGTAENPILIEPERREYSSAAVRQAPAGPRQIVGREGRPSRLMPPSTIAHYEQPIRVQAPYREQYPAPRPVMGIERRPSQPMPPRAPAYYEEQPYQSRIPLGEVHHNARAIIGKEGRPSRLMPPSRIAYFREEEEIARLFAAGEMIMNQGNFVRVRRGPTPEVQHPRPQRVLGVVDDFENGMQRGRVSRAEEYPPQQRYAYYRR